MLLLTNNHGKIHSMSLPSQGSKLNTHMQRFLHSNTRVLKSSAALFLLSCPFCVYVTITDGSTTETRTGALFAARISNLILSSCASVRLHGQNDPLAARKVNQFYLCSDFSNVTLLQLYTGMFYWKFVFQEFPGTESIRPRAMMFIILLVLYKFIQFK